MSHSLLGGLGSVVIEQFEYNPRGTHDVLRKLLWGFESLEYLPTGSDPIAKSKKTRGRTIPVCGIGSCTLAA